MNTPAITHADAALRYLYPALSFLRLANDLDDEGKSIYHVTTKSKAVYWYLMSQFLLFFGDEVVRAEWEIEDGRLVNIKAYDSTGNKMALIPEWRSQDIDETFNKQMYDEEKFLPVILEHEVTIWDKHHEPE